MNIMQRAELFAEVAHLAVGQRRKYTNGPYIVHPRAVAFLVDQHSHSTPEMVAAAWLHDVVEDTAVPLEAIDHHFGSTVALYVEGLTDITAGEGNRAERCKLNIERLAAACGQVQTIKYADIIDNTKDIIDLSPIFAVRYLSEKVDVLMACRDGEPVLWAKAMAQCIEGQRALQKLVA